MNFLNIFKWKDIAEWKNSALKYFEIFRIKAVNNEKENLEHFVYCSKRLHFIFQRNYNVS